MLNTKEKVFVGLSGGVDSSVAALRLLKDGYDVVGVFIKTWQPDFIQCDWGKERLDAMRVAAHLEIPFLTCDAEGAYKQSVADYMIDEYRKGRTPNPDVMCNKYVKFETFLKFALEHGADKIATGHYAQVKEIDGIYHLYRGNDINKDQSYFLWTLNQKQLKHTLFPVGNSDKSIVRKEAENFGLPTAKKQDSQGVCFLGDIDIQEFLKHFIETKKGVVLDKDGNAIGEHDGVIFYTLGQRHGFRTYKKTDSSTPMFVIQRDIKENTLTVSNTASKVLKEEMKIEKAVMKKPKTRKRR